MNAGRLRDRITVQTVTEVADGRGGFTQTASVLLRRIPAEVVMLSGRELDRAMQIDPRSRVQVTTRYSASIKAEHTVVYHSFEGDRTLEIVAPPQVEERDRTMTLLCGEAA